MSEPYDPDKFRWLRSRSLARCIRFRALMKKGDVHADDGHVYTVASMQFVLRKEQTALLKMRIWRATGRYPETN
jgi:hypothetical protein